MTGETILGVVAAGVIGCLCGAWWLLHLDNSAVGDARRLRRDWAKAERKIQARAEERCSQAAAIASRFRGDVERAVADLERGRDPSAVLDLIGMKHQEALQKLGMLSMPLNPIERPEPALYKTHEPVDGRTASRLADEIRAWAQEQRAAVITYTERSQKYLRRVQDVYIKGDPCLPPTVAEMLAELIAAAGDVIVDSAEGI
jgi:hypothetical protein